MGWRHQGLLYLVACTRALWACNKHAENVVSVLATRGGTEITVHSVETVCGYGRQGAARLSLHAEISKLQSICLGTRTTVYVCLQCRLLTRGRGVMENTRHTHTYTHTHQQCLWLLTSQIPRFWPKGVHFRAFLIEDSTWRLPWWTFCMGLINHHRLESTTEAIRALCWIRRMSQRKHHSDIYPPKASLFSKSARKNDTAAQELNFWAITNTVHSILLQWRQKTVQKTNASFTGKAAFLHKHTTPTTPYYINKTLRTTKWWNKLKMMNLSNCRFSFFIQI